MQSNALNQLRGVLDHFDGSDRDSVLMFFRAIYCSGPEAVHELVPRVTSVAAPKSLRHLAMEVAYYHPWPAWIPMLIRILRHELDFRTFQVGVQALGRIGGPESLSGLRVLSQIRTATGFQECVAEVLAETDPAEAFSHHLTGLMKGSASPAVANEAARQLGELLTVDSLDPLKVLLGHPDLLVFRHVLRLVARIPSPEAAEFLAKFIDECHTEILQDRLLKETLNTLRSLAAPAAAEEARKVFSGLLGERDPQARATLDGEPERISPGGVERLRRVASGPVEGLLLNLLAASAENKGARFPTLYTEASEEMHLRGRRQAFAMDVGAECFARMVRNGFLPLDRALDLLSNALRAQTGRDGLARALATLVPPENTELLDLLVLNPDNVVRAAALEVLGDRQEEALRPSLLKICRDPISDMALRTLYHLGRLPGAEAQACQMLAGGKPEDIQTGLRFIGMHRLEGLADKVLGLLETLHREDLVLETLEALGAMGSPKVAAPLLAQLQGGLGPRLQIAYAHTIRDLRDPGAANALAVLAMETRNPALHAVAVEALARVHGPDSPMDAEEARRLETLVREAWKDSNPWPLRLKIILALEELEALDPAFWARMFALLTEALSEKRSQTAVSPEELVHIQAVGKILLQRSSA